MPQARVLIVDDEADLRELLEITLVRMGLRSDPAGSLAEARAQLDEHEFDLCLTDMRLPDGNGIALVQHIQKTRPGLPVAVITAYGNTDAAIDSLKAGAFDFVSKPVDVQVLRKLVDTALKLRQPAPRASSAVAPSPVSARDEGGLLGTAPAIAALRLMIDKLSRSQAPVHVSGESGTGKELVARMIHAQSPRGDGPFVPVNCGAIPTELMESEFFGHRKGSFTGAVRDKTGLFQLAEGGTLFLDEVGDLPLHMQVKLLRALQERAVRPVGGDGEVPVNVRVISATHRDLAALVAQGSFRQDLYYRLNVIEIRTPPLREHAGDIPQIAGAILARLAPANGLSTVPKLDSAALKLLLAHPFAGNVRELENVLERAVALCDGERIAADDLQLRDDAAAPAAVPGVPSAAGGGLEDQMEDMERTAIRQALEKARYNKTKAAALLGMSFRSLRYRIKKLGIE